MNFNGKIISQQDSEMLSKAQNMYRVVLSSRKRNFSIEICNISCLVKMSAWGVNVKSWNDFPALDVPAEYASKSPVDR